MESRWLLVSLVTCLMSESFAKGFQKRDACGFATRSTASYASTPAESRLVATPANFYCVLVMKIQQELECYFTAWPGTHWNLSYFTNLPSNAISGSVEFSCATQHCGVNVPGAAQRITTYTFTLRNLTALPTNLSASISRHEICSDVYITRLSSPENLQLKPGRTHVEVTWIPPVSVYGPLTFELELLASIFGLEHEISFHELESREQSPETMRFSSNNMNILANITNVKPFSEYEIQVRSRVNGSTLEHAWSPPTTARVKSLEDVPSVAPEVIRDGFHLMKCNSSHCIAKIYWQGIQETSGKSNGKISGYLVTLDTIAQKFKVFAPRPPLVMTLDMTSAYRLSVQGETRVGVGPPSEMIQIPSLNNVMDIGRCALSAREINDTTVKAMWSLRYLSKQDDFFSVHIHWCYIVQSECADMRTMAVAAAAAGEAFITVDEPPVTRYRFGVSTEGSRERASGIVWSDCTEPSFDGAASTATRPAGLTEGAIVGIVVGITLTIIAVGLLIWRLTKDGKSIKQIKHIPKTQMAAEVPPKPGIYKYDTVMHACEFPPPTHSDTGWKATNYFHPVQKERDVHLQQSSRLLLSNRNFPPDGSLGAYQEPESGNCQAECVSESAQQYRRNVSLQDLIDQARSRQTGCPHIADVELIPGLDIRMDSADDCTSTFSDSWCPSILSEDRDDHLVDAKQKICSSPPTSSDYVLATYGEQQS